MATRSLERPDNDTMADRWLTALSESRQDLLSILGDVTHGELHTRIAPASHSIADYLWHVANVSLWWVKKIVCGEPIADAEKARFGLTRPGDIQRAPDEMDLDAFRVLLAETANLVESTYRHMPNEEFTAVSRPLGDGHVSPEWVIYNLLDHDANHRGQIAMLLRIMRS